MRGQKQLLRNIRRRKSSQTSQSSSSSSSSSQQLANLDPACVEVGRFGLDGEVERLKRDKQVLMMELVKLRQQQQSTKSHLQAMEGRLRKTELKQQQMMNFLARAMRNPSFVQQLVQQKEKRKELEEAIRRKRRRPIEQGVRGASGGVVDVELMDYDHHDVSQFIGSSSGVFVKMEPQDYSTINDMCSQFGEEVEEFDDVLTDDLQGVSEIIPKNMIIIEEEEEVEEEMKTDNMVREQGITSASYRDIDHQMINKDLDEGFWKNLLNESMEDGIGIVGVDEEDHEEDVDILAEQLGNYLASSPPSN